MRDMERLAKRVCTPAGWSRSLPLEQVGAANERQIRRHRPSSRSERDGMCRMPCGRTVVVPPAALRQVRPHRLLRYITEPARDGALPRDRPLCHHELRARRGLVLELPHGKTVLRPQAGAPAVAAFGSACPWTKGACPCGLGRLPQRISNRFALRPLATNTTSIEGETDVLPSGLAMHAVLEEYRGLARQGRAVRRREAVRCRRTFERPPGARHEAADLPGAERLRLRQSSGRLALGADAPETRRR